MWWDIPSFDRAIAAGWAALPGICDGTSLPGGMSALRRGGGSAWREEVSGCATAGSPPAKRADHQGPEHPPSRGSILQKPAGNPSNSPEC
jgi:hypothetical protein